MKSFIIGMALFYVSMIFTIFQQDYNMHQEKLYELKFVAEESAAAASQYLQEQPYAEGKIVFNQIEGIKATEYIIKNQLRLDDNMMPKSNSYWQEQVSYTIHFYDDATTSFPYTYSTNDGTFVLVMTEPMVLISINAGKPRYRLYNHVPDAIRIAGHGWSDR